MGCHGAVHFELSKPLKMADSCAALRVEDTMSHSLSEADGSCKTEVR